MPWQWACLACNETWSITSSAAHRCTSPNESMRVYWALRVRWAMPDATEQECLDLVTRPISRAQMVELFGASWDPAGDGAQRMPINAPREAT